MAQNVFLHNGGEHNAPVFGQHTDCKELWDWSRPKLAHVKLEHIPAIGKQDNDPFHAYQK